MSSKRFFIFTALVLGNAASALADAPLSAIDWLSDTVATPVVMQPPSATDITRDASVEDITVTTLDGPTPDAVGLLPVSVTGLPRNFWGATPSEELANQVRRQPVQSLPALEDLLKMILLAELDAPLDADGTGALFLARIDKLLDMGSLDQAQALLERAGPDTPDLFRRWFDVALLTGTEHAACAKLKDKADIAPTYPARVFCLARNGDWNAAAVTLETAKVLGYITKEEDALLARFLDPELFEGLPPLPVPKHVTPLIFRMREAIGEPIPTANLPLAFANADLRSNTGWKTQIEAAERLARTGAIDPNRLLGIYTERLPAASGGIWERVEAVQQFDTAMSTNDPGAVATALPAVWQEMQHAHLEVPFATLYGERLERLPLHDDAAELAFHIGLLSADYEKVAGNFKPVTVMDKFLVALAQGDVNGVASPDAKGNVVKPAFQANTAPVEFAPLLADNQLGKAILQAITLFAQGADGDLKDVRKALLLLRSVGLEDTARRAALQLMLLERRG
ncbi:hypothetical protein [Profundibacter sp.]